jgi:hypothetical protein
MERYAFFRASKFAKSLSHHGIAFSPWHCFLTVALLSHRGIAFSPWHCGLTVALQATVGFTDRRCVELTAM